MDEGSIYHEEQAKRVLEKIKLQLASGTFSPVSWGREKGVSFEKAWAIYEEQSRVGFERAKQREMVKEKFLLPYFTGKLLRDTLSYQRMIVMTLKAFFKFHEGSIRKLPKFPSVKLPKKEVKWLEDQQRDQVHEFILPHHLAVFKFMRITGCLLSEACNLRKETVDWNRKTFSFTNEQGKSVTSLPIIPEIDECFKTAETTADSQYVFCTARGQKYTRQVLYNVWASANRKANKKHGTPIVKLYEANRYSFSRQKFIWFSRNQQLSGE
jgi:integrase